MKKFIALFALFAGGAGSAVGACGAPYMIAGNITTLLSGKIARSPANCTGSGCQWQELHQASGALIEQHSGTVADPAETVGTWRVQSTGPGSDTITHTYTGGSAYTYQVKDERPTGGLTFCGSNGQFTFSVH